MLHVFRELSNSGVQVSSGNSGTVTGEVIMHVPSETFQLVHEHEIRPHKAEIIRPEQSSTFKTLERQLW